MAEGLTPEGFNPEIHQMLEDEKSWVNKEVPTEWDIEPIETKYEYNELVNKVVLANSEMSYQEAFNKIKDLEKKYDHELVGRNLNTTHPGQQLYTEWVILAFKSELNLLDEIESDRLEQLQKSFENSVDKVSLATENNDRDSILKEIQSILRCGMADNLFEAEKILIEGPIIEGFVETKDPAMPNELILEFLKNGFGTDTLRKLKLARVEKNDNYLIMPLGDNAIDQINDLVDRKLINLTPYGCLTENKEKYLAAAKILEEVDLEAELDHRFKFRSLVRQENGYFKIILNSFGVENVNDFDYLRETVLSDENKMRAYILGTLAHEVAHRYDFQLDRNIMNEFREIAKTEISDRRTNYVSNYVQLHANIHKTGELEVLGEDFAESVRIYLTNPRYLEKYYPNRFLFLKEKMPFLKPAAIIEAIQDLK